MMNKYELMYILLPNLSEDDIKNKNSSLQKIITDKGGKITGVNEWGLRDLAYEIKKQTQGYYVVVNFTADNKILDDFNAKVKLDPQVLRYLITRD